ncbi:MAG: TonB-dependent receptor [Flavobacteriaceae bacterium]|nr:TonB-dependent receptor [Flavobacteriaceae bacterium]
MGRARFIVLFIVINCCLLDITAQTVLFSGRVVDSLQNPISNVNVLALPTIKTDEIQFAITNKMGQFKLRLLKEKQYTLQVSCLGYTAYSENISLAKDLSKTIFLKATVTQLDEVVLTYKIPIVVKKDTLIYNPKAFTNGKERKLKDVLKKLPGIEMEDDGSVTVKGQQVTDLLVDNKPFFNGNVKLGIQNIPAEVIEEIDVYEDYNRVSFLKGLNNSNSTALNIKLKEDKKRFYFGTSEAGVGVNNRYTLKPSLFYKSPRTEYQTIVAIDNNREEVLSFEDIMRFENAAQFMNKFEDFSLHNELLKFINPNSFINLEKQFYSGNVRQEISPKSSISSYVLYNKETINKKNNFQHLYFTKLGNNEEKRLQREETNGEVFLANLKWNFYTDTNTDILLTGSLTNTNTSDKNDADILSFAKANSLELRNKSNTQKSKFSLDYNREVNTDHTISIQTALETNENGWNAKYDNSSSSLTTLTQQHDNQYSDRGFALNAIDYWELNNKNHIYVGFEAQWRNENLKTYSEGINWREQFGVFKNDIEYSTKKIVFGADYKLLLGDFIVQTGAHWGIYSWQNAQEQDVKNKLGVFLPSSEISYEINSMQKLRFKYKATIELPLINQLLLYPRLENLNVAFIGNPNLQYQKQNLFSLHYNSYNIFKGISIITSLGYARKSTHFQTNNTLEGIRQIQSVTVNNQPVNNFFLRFHWRKRKKKIKYSFRLNSSFEDFYTEINESLFKQQIFRASIRTAVTPRVWKPMELDLGGKISFSNTVRSSSSLRTTLFSFYINKELAFWKHFVSKLHISKQILSTATSKSEFIEGDFSIFYKKASRPLGIELIGKNMFNSSFRESTSETRLSFTTQQEYVMPRTFLLKLSYDF